MEDTGCTEEFGVPERIGRYVVEALIGHGGFGMVFRAMDPELHRRVAIKVPHRRLVSRPEDAKPYLAEARTVASLDHPNIVPVYDAGSAAPFPCFVVSKYIEGQTLAQRMHEQPLSMASSLDLLRTVAEALHYAHGQGIVHRDIKPGNILLDRNDKPYVSDFGLALREENIGQGPRFAGTLAYMSPEQARGEGHRVDGRSDIFSLGVVCYELLTGHRPFRANSRTELLEQIASMEVRPPRQWNDAISKEVERICLKALAKLATDRYMTAHDLADDLRQLPAGQSSPERFTLPKPAPVDRPAPTPLLTPTPIALPIASDQHALRIVPKGLRSFGAEDVDFFLELLPGPRDRDGMPESLRFWKKRIEEMDSDSTFTVGLMYGPSGCGKTSLMKAGLLPRLTDQVVSVYVEADAGETEKRLTNGLAKKCTTLPAQLNLKDALAAVRQGRGIPPGKKLLIVVDQFEQWLHANKDNDESQLVQALRQCDGGRVQCILMVRDDFWLAISRFMKLLEVRLLEGRNSALVDLFPIRHAEKVLAAFGRAFGALPETPGDLSKEQRQFVEQAVDELAQDHKVVCVRLALFAEMMKGRPWTLASLKQVGGTEGIGTTFLEEMFSAETAPPEHRCHQRAARAVLKALLPESSTEIKGHMRSRAELLSASGYQHRSGDFDDLLAILDGGLRLITPTEPEAVQVTDEEITRPAQADASTAPRSQKAGRYYQLAHDYLVPSLRDWLTRKQMESSRGRAELLLSDHAAAWGLRRENRLLPSFFRWVRIRLLTTSRNWTAAERNMMRRSARYHGIRAAAVVVGIVLLSLVGVEAFGRSKAHDLRRRVLEANTGELYEVVDELPLYRRWVDPLLMESLRQAEQNGEQRQRLHISLALLPTHPTQADYLHERLLEGDPEEVEAIRRALKKNGQERSEQLWKIVEDANESEGRRFRAACALANYAPMDERWQSVSSHVALELQALAIQKPFEAPRWAELLRPVSRTLLDPFGSSLEDARRTGPELRLLAGIYASYGADVTGAYDRLEQRLLQQPDPQASDQVRNDLGRKQSALAIALVLMGRDEPVWPLLKHSSDPTLRSFLIGRLEPGTLDAELLIARLDGERDLAVRQALLLSLGQYPVDRMPAGQRNSFLTRVRAMYRDDPNPGIHSALRWLLRQWQQEEQIKRIDSELQSRSLTPRGTGAGKLPVNEARWCVNSEGQTLVILPVAGEVSLDEGAQMHPVRIRRSFAITAEDVTVEQFLHFRPEYQSAGPAGAAPADQCPVSHMSWHDAAAYCNWLSLRDGISPSQLCYELDETNQRVLRMKNNYLSLEGYRLPTDAEWEYACRAGTATEFNFGRSAEDLLQRCAWLESNASSHSHPVGRLRPNEFGLFDMHGNMKQWTQDRWSRLATRDSRDDTEDDEDIKAIDDNSRRAFRGGGYRDPALFAGSGVALHMTPTLHNPYFGFRVARSSPQPQVGGGN